MWTNSLNLSHSNHTLLSRRSHCAQNAQVPLSESFISHWPLCIMMLCCRELSHQLPCGSLSIILWLCALDATIVSSPVSKCSVRVENCPQSRLWHQQWQNSRSFSSYFTTVEPRATLMPVGPICVPQALPRLCLLSDIWLYVGLRLLSWITHAFMVKDPTVN